VTPCFLAAPDIFGELEDLRCVSAASIEPVPVEISRVPFSRSAEAGPAARVRSSSWGGLPSTVSLLYRQTRLTSLTRRIYFYCLHISHSSQRVSHTPLMSSCHAHLPTVTRLARSRCKSSSQVALQYLIWFCKNHREGHVANTSPTFP
jgi:hypothetical protein